MTDILQNSITFGKTAYQNAKNIATVCVWSNCKALFRQTMDNTDGVWVNIQLFSERYVHFVRQWKGTVPSAVFKTVSGNAALLRDSAVTLWQTVKENASSVSSALRMIWKTAKESAAELRQMFAA